MAKGEKSAERDLVQFIKDQLDRLFADTTVAPSVTRERLEDIQEHIEEQLASLPDSADDDEDEDDDDASEDDD